MDQTIAAPPTASSPSAGQTVELCCALSKFVAGEKLSGKETQFFVEHANLLMPLLHAAFESLRLPTLREIGPPFSLERSWSNDTHRDMAVAGIQSGDPCLYTPGYWTPIWADANSTFQLIRLSQNSRSLVMEDGLIPKVLQFYGLRPATLTETAYYTLQRPDEARELRRLVVYGSYHEEGGKRSYPLLTHQERWVGDDIGKWVIEKRSETAAGKPHLQEKDAILVVLSKK